MLFNKTKPKKNSNPITTLEMEYAMLHFFNVYDIVVPNVSFGIEIEGKCLHECDLLRLTKANFAYEIEIKVSKSDLLKDKQKRHSHDHVAIKELWYAVPHYLQELALNEIPENAGLYVVIRDKSKYVVHVARKATPRPIAHKWTEDERYKLVQLGLMRIRTWKRQILRMQKK